jgi:OPA family glycerol-3-phosphate transporter-like MFS transporter
MTMIGILKSAPHAAPVAPENVSSDYKRLRLQVFAGIFVGYVASYLIRKNFSLAIPDILNAYPQYTKADLAGMVFSP